MEQRTGFVRWFNLPSGYGFRGSHREKDVFVHYSSIEAKGYRTVREGEPVFFDDMVAEEMDRPADLGEAADRV